MSDLSAATAQSSQALLETWNATQSEYPDRHSVHQLFEIQVEQTPDAVALIFGDERLTYRELNQRANQLAHELLRRGVGNQAETLVGICLPRSLELVIAVLGVLKAGGAYLPLDPVYPADRLAYMLQDAQAALVLTQEQLLDRIPAMADRSICLDRDQARIASMPMTNPAIRVLPDNLAYVMYTSGSTGRPKGVLIPHRGLCNMSQAEIRRFGITPADRVLQFASFSFDVTMWEILMSLLSGASLYLARAETLLPGPALIQLLNDHAITVATLPPAVLTLLPTADLPSLRVLISAADVCPAALVERWSEGRLFFNAYGPTEITICATVAGPLRGSSKPPIGLPLQNLRLYVLDSQMQRVPAGDPGELYIGGVGVGRGYHGRPDLTAEKFLPDPFSGEPGARLYRTGDLVCFLPDGNVDFLGRVDFQVKIRGFRIELGEIEAVLRQHPAVREAIVVAREDLPGNKRLVAYVVEQRTTEQRTSAGDSGEACSLLSVPCSPQELRAFLQTRLPEHMIPSAFVVLDALPLNSNGKIDRKALPAPDTSRPDLEAAFVAPRTPTEAALAELWAEVLGLDRVGVHDQFFLLGGHSLAVTQVVARIRELFQVELPLNSLFAAPTIAEFALLIEQASAEKHAGASTTIQPVPRNQPLPLSFAQEQVWVLQELNPANHSYSAQATLRLTGTVDASALQWSLNEIVRRHEILRTTFPVVDGRPVQVIHEPWAVPLPLIDLEQVPVPEREAALNEVLTTTFQQPFVLDRLPLVRWALARLGEREHVLIHYEHHFVHDGWSFGVFMHELLALYQAATQGKPARLPDLPIQFADFAVWQRAWMEQAEAARQLSFWRDRLAGSSPLLELPTDYPRPAMQRFRGSSVRLELPPALCDAAYGFAREQGVTLFMTLLAAFTTLMQRYSNQHDINIGSGVANRRWRETESIIGMIVNMVVLRMQTVGDPTFRDLLERARQVALEAYAHQDLPFERVVEALQPKRNLSYNPIFQVAFSFHNAPMPDLDLPDLSVDISEALSNGSAKFDLNIVVIPRTEQWIARRRDSDVIKMIWEYNSDLFKAETIQRMTEHFQVILAAMIANPQQRIATSPLLTEAEHQQLLIDWNATALDYPQDRCIHELFAQQAALWPQALALADDQREISYGELNRLANLLAHDLHRQGVGPETLVAVCLQRSIELVIALLAVLKAGGAYLPLDPAYPAERIEFMLADSSAAVLLTEQALLPSLPPHAAPTICVDRFVAATNGQSVAEPISAVTPDHLAYMIYTSGSTGQPKGVLIPHRGVQNLVAWHRRAFGLTDRDRTTQIAGPAFDAMVWEVWSALLTGASLHIPDDEIRATPDRLRDWLCDRAISVSFLPTPLAEQVLALDWPQTISLRLLLTGGDKLHHAPAAPLPFTLVNNYGPTECTVVATSIAVPPGSNTDSPPIGHPIANTEVYILDADMQPVPVGVPGELYLNGAGLARGYHGRPDLTAEKLVPHPFSPIPGARLYRTGDLVRYRVDGSIEFVGRIDQQVKIRGFRIELGEIEAALLQHPAVGECAVQAREVSGETRLVAYVVQNQDTQRVPGTKNQGVEPDGSQLSALGSSDLRAFLRQRLPEYMIPAAFVALDALPITANGKVDLRALPEPDWSLQSEERAFVPPRTATEQRLSALWSDLLGVTRVSVHDSFFDLGGHSLLATQLLSRVRDQLGAALPLHALFDAPTIAGIAELIEQSRAAAIEPGLLVDLPIDQALHPYAPPPITRRGETVAPVSFAQQRLWFLDQLEPGNAAYNICRSLVLSGSLNVAALENSLNALVQRHESLRTTFGELAGLPVQRIAPAAQVALPLIDLTHLAAEERTAAARQLAQDEARQTFDLRHGPLLRARLLRLEPTEYVLVLTLHHSICDGWSLGVLLDDLAALYGTALAGQAAPLPDLAIQYADYAIWQREWLQGEVLESQLDYWRHQLADSPALLAFPSDRPRPAVPTNRGALLARLLPRQLADDLAAFSRGEGVTLFMTLLAAFDVLLHRYSGQDDILVGTPIANRTRAETERLVGLFTNTLVLRANLGGRPSFRDLLRQVRDAELGAYAHQDLPFEKLVEALHPDRDLAHTPLFQAMFILQNQQRAPGDLSGVRLRLVAEDTGTTAFDLTLSIEEQAEGLLAEMQYSSDLFDAATIERLLGQLEVLLAGIVAAADQPISRLPLLSDWERQQILVDWNRTAASYPQERCIHELIAEQASSTPGAIAVSFGADMLTYAELESRANQLARHLRSLGVGPESVAGICLPRSLEQIVALLAVLKAGGAYLPLDPALPQERLRFILHDARAAVVLTQHDLTDRLNIHDAQIVCLDREVPQTKQQLEVAPAALPQHPAYLIYTSGSTGQPKGVVIPHEALVARSYAAATQYQIQPGDRVLHFATLSFDVAAEEIFPTLLGGATLVLWPQPDVAAIPEFQRWLERERLTVLNLPMPYWHAWVAELDAAPLPPSLRLLIAGSDQTAPEWLLRWQQRGGTAIPWYNAYGPTEATITSTLYTEADAMLASERGIMPIGRPIANTEAYVLDADIQPVPVGVPGELFLGGIGLARGYHGRPDLTAERFVPHPFSDQPGARLYRTGDRVRYRVDGNLEFLGRIDEQVKLRGFRIELGEIEAVLREQEAVQEAVVVLRDERLVAYVVENKGTQEQEGLHSFLQARLPSYMIPAAFVALDALPLTPSGKIDRRALPQPSDLRDGEQASYLAPRTPLEAVLADIWAELLGREQISVDDNFFQLGGHSLLATQVAARIREDLEIELPLRRLFETPTIAGLAESLRRDPAQAQHVDKIAQLIVQLAQMSESEAATMLAQTRSHSTRNQAP